MLPSVITKQVCTLCVWESKAGLISPGQTHKGWFVTSASDVTRYGLCCLIVSSCSEILLCCVGTHPLDQHMLSLSLLCCTAPCVCRCTPFCALNVTLRGVLCTVWDSLRVKPQCYCLSICDYIIAPVFLKMDNVRMYVEWQCVEA